MSTPLHGPGVPAYTAGIPGAHKEITVNALANGKPCSINVQIFEHDDFLHQHGASRIFFTADNSNRAAQHHIDILHIAELLSERHRICMESNDASTAKFLLNPRGQSLAQVAVDGDRLNIYNFGVAAAQQEVPFGYEDEHAHLVAFIKNFEAPPPEEGVDNMEATAPIKTVVLDIAADEAKNLGIDCLPVAIRCGCDAILLPDGRIGKLVITE